MSLRKKPTQIPDFTRLSPSNISKTQRIKLAKKLVFTFTGKTQLPIDMESVPSTRTASKLNQLFSYNVHPLKTSTLPENTTHSSNLYRLSYFNYLNKPTQKTYQITFVYFRRNTSYRTTGRAVKSNEVYSYIEHRIISALLPKNVTQSRNLNRPTHF
jgi:hypothetical protein